jgi:hypothetical protein
VTQTVIIGVVFQVALLALILLLRRSAGAWWRLGELPGLVSGRSTRWVAQPGLARGDIRLLRLIVVSGYLTATVSEVNDFVRDLVVRLRDPLSSTAAHKEAINLLRALWRRSGAIVFVATCAALIDLVAAVTISAAGHTVDALGHFATPFVMVVMILGLSDEVDGVRTVAAAPRLGFVIWAFRMLAVGAAVSLAIGTAWSRGATGAYLLGVAALALATIGGLTPFRRWLNRGYSGWRRRFAPSLIVAAAALGAVATVWELVTMHVQPNAFLVLGNIDGAVAFLTASYVFSVLGLDPPELVEIDVAHL